MSKSGMPGGNFHILELRPVNGSDNVIDMKQSKRVTPGWVLAPVMTVLALASLGWAADTAWQPARIVSVKSETQARNTVWVVNTPIVDEQVVCTVAVHVHNRIVTGSYVPGESHPVPPPAWAKDRPVQVQIAGDYLYVRSSPADEVRLRISTNKSAPMMRPWTAEEASMVRDALAGVPAAPAQSMIGFDASAKSETPAQPAPQATPPEPAPPPAEPATGQVSITSFPYLAEVFVDGESVGYTPAKLHLAPGKHTFRCDKPGYKSWTKEITVTAGSELTLDATLPAGSKK
jgi:hypothetical protein